MAANTQIIDGLALVPLTQTEVANLNLSSLGVITITSASGGGDMMKSTFATINPGAGFVDKAINATQVPYSGLTSLPGGTVLFLRADGSFAQPPGQTYSVVSTANPGLVPILPGSSSFSYYFRGDGQWQLSSSLAIGWTQLTGTPSTFTPSPHAIQHITTGNDVIPPATTTKSGLVPILPASGLQSTSFLRGDSTWAVIPSLSVSTPGLAPQLPGNITVFLRGDGSYATPVYGSLASIPASFTPSQHASTHITAGQDLIPNFSIGGANPGLVPGSPGGSTLFLRADGTWFAPTGSGGLSTSSGAGLMSQLPSTAQTTYYWGGDNLPHLISTLSLTYSQVTGVPIFSGSFAGLVPASSGGTINFLRADGVYSQPTGAVVTTSSPGSVSALPATAGATFYLNGNDVWTLISTLPIAYSQLTGLPSSFPPIAHQATHVTGGLDQILPPTTSRTGIVPVLPTNNPTLNFLRGDGAWSTLPVATGSASGLVPTPTNSLTQWFRADATFQTIPNVTNLTPGLAPAFPGNTTTFLSGAGTYISVDYSSAVSGKPSTFTPALHATQHITGGNDIIPVFTNAATGLVPIAGAGGTYLNSAGGWTTPSGAGDVSHTRQILTPDSIKGGGDLSSDRTLILENDAPAPGNSQVYGTNSSGTRGWFAFTTFPQATSSVAGLVPTPTGSATVFLSGSATFVTPPTFASGTPGYAPSSGGGTANFLRADGSWQPPPIPGLATTSVGGIVPAQPASAQTTYYLRGDDTWQLVSGLSIAFSQLTSVPVFSGTSTNGLVPGATAGSASTFLRGDGVFATPALASSAVAGYIAGLPSASATNFWARGDNSWQLLPNNVVVSSSWTMPIVGGTVSSVTVNSTSILQIGMTVLTGLSGGTQCLMEISGIAGSTISLINRGYVINPGSGTSIPGSLMSIVGPGVSTASNSGFVPTPTGSSTQYLDGTGNWSTPPGSGGLGSVTTQFSVTGTGALGSPVQLVNDTASPGSFMFYSTNAVGTLGWFPLTYSWETSGTFVMPGVGSTQTISLVSNVGVTVGSTIVIEDSTIPPNQAFLEVISVNGDGTHVVVNNRGYAFNVAGGATFASSAAVTLAGPGVAANGVPGFVPHSGNDTVNFLRADGTFATPANVTTSTAGYVPVAPGDPTKFLNGNGLFTVPSVGSLAVTGTPGAVAGLPATNQSTSFLRGDNTWQLTSTLSSQILYASLSGLPSTFAPSSHASSHISTGADAISTFSTTTTTSGLVVGSNNVGTTFFLRADGTWATPPSGPGNASAGVAGLVVGLIASPTLQYLRGDNSWQPIANLAVDYTKLTNVPASFTPSAHAATHLDNGTDPIAVVAGVRTGLVPVLPASAPTTKFLRGDATWTVIPNFATNAVTPGLVVGSNSVSNINFLRADNTWNAIQTVSTSNAGLAPILPASNGTSTWLRGDASWVSIPFYWTISASFTQPAISGTVAVTFLSTTGQQAGMCIATVDTGSPPVTNYYTIQTVTDGTHSTLINLGASGNTAAASTVNAGQCNLNGPPVMTSSGSGIVPVPSGVSTQYLSATGIWSTPPSSGVPISRNVLTQYSLAGGGALSADITLNLVNDTASPGASQLYGTNSGGTRGWYASNSFPLASLTNAGLLLTLTGSTSNFLRADGSWAPPSGLAAASTGVAGIVTGLPATNQTTQWLRADNSWAFLPDSNVTTSSWVMPAIGATVTPVTFNSTGNWDVGMTLFFATGSGSTCCFMEVTTVNDAVTLTLANRGYQTNPIAGTTIPTCLVFVVSAGTAKYIGGIGYSGLMPPPTSVTTQFLNGNAAFTTPLNFTGTTPGYVPGTSAGSTTVFLRGDATWATPPGGASTTAGANFTWPAVGGSTISILVGSSSQMMVGSSIYVPVFGTAEVTSIADGTHCVLRNNGNSGNVTSGTVLSGAGMFIGTAGALATATASGMIPVPPNDATKVLLGTGAFGTLAYSSLGSIPTTPPLHASTHVTGGTDIIGPATTSVTGLVPVLPATNGTDKWLRGDSTWVQGPPLAIATASFTWPAVAGTVVVTVDSSALMRQNMGLYASGLGICEVTNIGSGTSITIRNNGNTGNAGSTASQTPAFYAAGAGALATATSSGMIPVPPNNTTTFLRGDASFATPSSVSTSAPGYVPTAPASASQWLNGLSGTWTTIPAATSTVSGLVPTPPNNTDQWLRGDATWVQAPPLAVVITATFTWPASAGTVAIAVDSSSNMMVGCALYFPGFGIAEVTVVTDSTHVTIRNNLNTGNATSGTVSIGQLIYAGTAGAAATSTTSGMVPTPSGTNPTDKWLRGDMTWVTGPGIARVITATFSWPGVGSTVAIAVDYTANMMVGGSIYFSGWGVAEVTVVTDSTHCTIRNNGNSGTLTSGTVALNTVIYAGTAGALATATASGMIPVPPNNTTTFLRGDATFATPPSATSTVAGYVPTPPNNTYQFLNGQAAWVTPCITYARFKAYDNIPYSTTYPAFNVRGGLGLPVLDCADAVTTDCVFSDVMPQNVNLGSGLTVIIKWTAHTATTGAVRWQVAFDRLNASIAAASFDTAGLVTSTTSGTVDTIATATVSALTTINGITAGDLYVVKVSRLGADGADTMTDTAELCSVEVRSAGT